MRASEFVRKHGYLPEESWPHAIPIGFHGDGGAFNKHDQLYALSWNSLIASGPTIQTKFIFSVIRKSDMVADTLDELIRSFCWSVNVLLTGFTPIADWNGLPVEGGNQPLLRSLFWCFVSGSGGLAVVLPVLLLPAVEHGRNHVPLLSGQQYNQKFIVHRLFGGCWLD